MTSTIQNLVGFFVKSAGFILMILAMDRFLIVVANVPALSMPDPVMGVPLHYSVLVVGALELLVSLICLFGRRTPLQIGWLAWLITTYWIVRIAIFWMGWHPQLTGIGRMADPMGIFGRWEQIAGFVYLVGGSYVAALFWLPLHEKSRAVEPDIVRFIKMSCVLCAGHIEFPAYAVGQKIPCPHCGKTIALLDRA